ncbi:hypothetical protein B0H13DRAFT_2366443 [Mycena leptocephala]|nr:hypothetical protein B0H13DRAFT_2366443 [Mycena leptocephala]
MSQITLLTSGVKNNELQGSSKAPTAVDRDHKALYGCVVQNGVITHNWTYEKCTKYFAEIFPKAFEYAMMHTQTPEGVIWMIGAKEYKALRLIPKVKPTGADIISFKQKDVPLYIVLVKSIPDEVYASWYNGPTTQSPVQISMATTNPMPWLQMIPRREWFQCLDALAASESDSELDDVTVKKRKLDSGKLYTTQIASSSRRSEPFNFFGPTSASTRAPT